jgi:hypothetical protein
VKVGREDEARFILGRLRGDEGQDVLQAEAEFQDIRNVSQLEKEAGGRISYWAMFTGRRSGDLHIGRRVQLVIWLQIMQEWVGIAGVTICESFSGHQYVSRTDKTRCPHHFSNCWIRHAEKSVDQWSQ